jgi:dsDNA-specific endonuclease/ATPase MutS2
MENNNEDLDAWKQATNNVHPLGTKQMPSMKDRPVYTTPVREVLGYDLHGMTVQQAFDHTIKLCSRAYNYHMDKITIITGKSGQIRREFESWLDNPQLSQYVRFCRAQSSGGSFVVYMKKH